MQVSAEVGLREVVAILVVVQNSEASELPGFPLDSYDFVVVAGMLHALNFVEESFENVPQIEIVLG